MEQHVQGIARKLQQEGKWPKEGERTFRARRSRSMLSHSSSSSSSSREGSAVGRRMLQPGDGGAEGLHEWDPVLLT
jgi:hypothetical protein